MSDLIIQINKLPEELIDVIKEYIPKKCLVFLNKTNYLLHHEIIRKYIINYENFIRDVIRRDNSFVFERIIAESYQKWFRIKNYRYKNIVFNNYAYFIINYCIENDSNNCKKITEDFFKELGLCKNLHKKNIIKYIKWKN
jgi:hypothetical protein